MALSQRTPGSSVALRGGQRDGATAGRASVDGRTAFAGDMRVALMLLNNARWRSLERYLGVSKEQANLATAILLLMIVENLRRRIKRVFTPPGAPSFDGFVVATASARQLVWQVTGMPGDEPPPLGPLIALALAAPPVRRMAMRSAHGITGGAHRMAVGFHGRYGYLVDPGHRRQRRAMRSAATAAAPGR